MNFYKQSQIMQQILVRSTQRQKLLCLFQALEECLSGYEINQSNPSFFLINHNNHHRNNNNNNDCSEKKTTKKYAVGFACNARPFLDLFKDRSETSGDDLMDSGMSSISKMITEFSSKSDHSVCVFRQIDDNRPIEENDDAGSKTSYCDEWELLDCLATVQLRLGDTSCVEFTRDNYNHRIEPSGADQLEDDHVALSHSILYTMDCVLPYHARRGKLGKEPLPMAIVAATKEELINDDDDDDQVELAAASTKEVEPDAKKARKLQRTRWVSGQLHVPEALGNRFHFSVKDFGCFDDENSVENALALYFETMLFGLKVAVEVLHELAGDVPLSPPVPASGQHLMIGSAHLEQLEYCASPIVGANPTRWSDIWSIKQGDLYVGKLKVRSTVEDVNNTVEFLSSNVGATAELDVLVKVSSTAVHSVLVNPKDTFTALTSIRFSTRNRYAPQLKTLVDELGNVLYAVVNTDVGVLTIMADLSTKGYKALRPKDYDNDLSSLWVAFGELVKKVLLPMAEIAGVIHPDIRPGYDLTANILVHDSTSCGNISMKLIDYESLVCFRDWECPNLAGRYLHRDDFEDATTFLWWQCVGLAYIWSEKISVKPRTGETPQMNKVRGILLDDDEGPQWLMDLRDRANGKVTPAQVESTLVDLANVFKADCPVGAST
jgi:hypothetical protein